MNTLPLSRIEHALHFIDTHGRDLDRALAGYYFGETPLAAVLDALRSYANADGGFGHGLEPDFLLPESSPMATSIALQILADLKVWADAPLVVGALDYLAKARDSTFGVWHSAPASVNDHPHAPWWHQGDEPATADSSDTAKTLRFNPGPEIIGYFLRWPHSNKADVAAWLNDMMQHLLEAETLEAHAFLCFARLADQPNMPAHHRTDLTACLQGHVADTVEPKIAASLTLTMLRDLDAWGAREQLDEAMPLS